MVNEPFNVVETSSPLFVDAYALEGDCWIFGSFWGNETVIQEFLARLTLPNHEQLGLRSFSLETANGEFHRRIQAGQADRLSKLTARTPASTVLGSLCHVWIFDPALQKPDRSSGTCYVLSCADETEDALHQRIWSAIQDLSQLPLLDHWRWSLLPMFFAREWIAPLESVGVQGYRIGLPIDAFEALVTEGIRNQQLTLQPVPAAQVIALESVQTSLW